MGRLGWILLCSVLLGLPAHGADNLKLNQHLDYSSDSQDGPLITADHLEDGSVAGRPTYAIIYGEACFNSKRQARRTVSLYERYRGKVQFVIVDLDRKRSVAQDEFVKKFYTGSIPHVVILDRDGKAVYNAAGEIDEAEISKLLDRTLAEQP